MRTRIAGVALVVALGVSLFFAGRGLFSSRQSGRALDTAPAATGVTQSARSSNFAARPGSVPLPPSREEQWSRPASEPVFARFADWANRYAAAAPQAKTALEADGVVLARERLAALTALIQTNPERALELAAPHAVRQAMPDAVKALLEQPVNTRGDYQVIGMLPASGVPTDLPPVLRAASIDGQQHQVFTYGPGLDYVTRQDVPLNGIAVPADLIAQSSARQLLQATKLMALNPNPARLLDRSEVRELAARRAQEPVCATSGQPVTSRAEETAVELGGIIRSFCENLHAQDWAGAQVAAFGGESSLTGDGSTTGGPPLTGFDGYTTGRKRFLILRPRFADVNSTMTDAQVPGHFNSFSNFMYEMSWGKLVFAGLGAGSDATPIMLLPGNAADYDNTGLGKLYDTCKAVAQTNYGYNLSQYDFLYVVTGGQPAAGYAGLGFVRGVGFHLANGYYGAGTAAHEFGHNLGLNHANFWSTGGKTVIGGGNSVEYGDGNDTMGGGGGSPQHYVSRYKNYLTWIANGDVATITSANSGTYRLYALDQADVVGSYRGLKVARTGSQNYWVHFRQRYTGKAMLNGVQLLWTGNGNQSSLLLDTRLKNGSSDNALVIGRTFSDSSLGMHITPIGKGHTAPESMDVVVNVGTFPANLPPVGVVSASTTNTSAGQTITFNAAATDPNGDSLAYAWDFGDDDYSIDNSATTTHSFDAAGEYVVQCTVSDMKGGTARDSVLVRVGSPGTFRISGRVLRLDQRGYPGVKVSADSSHFAFADSDGTYTIAGLGAGSYTLSALETVSGSPTFVHPFFANPVVVGPSAVNMDFIVGTSAPPVTLVATGAVWKYLDNGTDQGTAWRAVGFVDTAWASGPGQFGYGETDQATVISYGGNANAKYTTTYFRRAFNVANAATLTNLTVSLLRDDGGIVYLNGVEIFRSNMPAGAATYATFASSSIDDQVFFSGPVPSGILISGTNVLAVELHQADLTTSDASFDLSLAADSTASLVQGSVVYLSSPESGSAFTSPTNLTLNASAVTTSGSFTNVEFFDGAVKLGEDAGAPFTFAWNGVPAGGHTLTVRAKNTSGITVTSGPVNITVTPPSSAPPAVALSLVSIGAGWRYLAGASPAPANWASAAFNDSGWPAGNAELGYGDGGEATVLSYGGDANAKWTTYYFRRAFTVNDPAAVTNLVAQLKRDDGGIVYLNGIEVFRSNITNTPVTYATFAFDAADDGQSFFSSPVDPTLLVPGTNVIAVEIHQANLTSSDLSFDLRLDALASTNRPRGVYLVLPLDGASVTLPNNATIAAQVVAGGDLGVAKVEFYGGGVKIGEDTAAPYSLIWSNLPSGAQQIFAVATDSAGGSITSAPVSILVTAPPLTTQLISSGDVWKYLDDGTDPGTAWRARLFNDSDWNEGAARLGYGGDGEVTTMSYGPDVNNRHVTTYFRHAFNLANPAAFTSVRLRLIRDDGAVVYLNGTEVFRSNMAAGLISANSLALLTVNAPEETTFYETVFSTAGLVAGTNVVAVEVHQAGVTSSDLGFDLALIGVKNTNAAQGVYLSSPSQGADYDMPATVAISAFVASTSGVSKVEFFDGANKLGETTSAPFNFAWNSAPAGTHTLTARATDNAALTMTSPPVAITVSPATLPSASVATMFFPARSSWTYLDDGSNQGSNWTSRTFNTAAWKTGAGRFGYGYDGETTKLGTNITTHYFRKWFTVANPGQYTELLFRLQRDDGAVVHLNGQEIYRSNMPTGAVNSATLAATTANSLDENYVFETFIPTPGSGLLLGSNLVAVELHQSSATSSDAGFDLELWGYGTTEPRVYLANPYDGANCALPVDVQIDANAWAGTGRAVSKVEFFDGANKLGETSATPYHWTWPNPPAGTHVLSAVATDNGGRLIGSDPVTITVTQPPLTLLLVATGSVWKYLDNGSNQGTNWAQRGYNDASWAAGPAELGYANNPVTVVSFGPSSNNKYITTYFRRWFSVPDDAAITNYSFRLKRDDGAVVYMNGREVFRSNMPTGAVSYTTPASASVGGTDEATFFPFLVPATNLVAGTNLLAVEVHQNAADSSDLSFDLELTGTGYAVYLPLPTAAVMLVGGQVQISWPSAYTSWRVYATTNILTPMNQWTLMPNLPVVVGSNNVVTITPSSAVQFLRLGKP